VKDALRAGGVTICAGQLAGAGYESPKIEQDEKKERKKERKTFI
jgi:hypothetical protein